MRRQSGAQGAHRPFRVLKALIDSGDLRLASGREKPVDPPPPFDSSLSEEEAFRRAMRGVRRLGWSKTPLRLPTPVVLDGGRDEEAEALEQLRDFARSQGGLDPFATGEGVEGAATRRGRLYLGRLKAGDFSVQDQLDLHGMSLKEARPRLESFIGEAVRRGLCCVRIVHGRGTHSSAEPAVLKTHVARWLASRRMSRLVVAFTSARWQDGGSGAVYVLLYRQRR